LCIATRHAFSSNLCRRPKFRKTEPKKRYTQRTRERKPVTRTTGCERRQRERQREREGERETEEDDAGVVPRDVLRRPRGGRDRSGAGVRTSGQGPRPNPLPHPTRQLAHGAGAVGVPAHSHRPYPPALRGQPVRHLRLEGRPPPQVPRVAKGAWPRVQGLPWVVARHRGLRT